MKHRLAALLRKYADQGFGYLTLNPSSRLRRLRGELEAVTGRPGVPLPPLPDSAYPPGAVPLDTSGVPPAPVS